MADVAARAGVSVTTVSHVLNDVPGKRIPPSTEKRVRVAGARLSSGTWSTSWPGVRRQRTRVIGLISDEVLITPFAAVMVHGALEAAAELGWMVVLTNTGVDRTFEAQQIRALQERQVDGFLYVRMYHQEVNVPTELDQRRDGAGGRRRAAMRRSRPSCRGNVSTSVELPPSVNCSVTGTPRSGSSTTRTTSWLLDSACRGSARRWPRPA